MNSEQTKTCYRCGETVTVSNGVQWGSYFYCDDCFKETKCHVDQYHHPTLETTFLSERGETTKLYFGFELEINKSNERYNYSESHHTDAIFYIRKNFKHLKLNFEQDGSIGDGFEIISQPMTYKYLKAHQEDFKKILSYLSEHGYRSHNSGKCGLHVHISRDFLGNNSTEVEQVVNKITLFVETYYNNMSLFARRGNCDYCNYITPLYKTYFDQNVLPTDDYLKSTEILKDLKEKTRPYATSGHSRYFVVNTTNPNTIEYRMFKGTLKYETFMATLEFVNNLTNVCKENMVSKISWNKVINYSGDFIKEYNEGLGIIGDAYLRDYTEQINQNINKFKEKDKENYNSYTKNYKEIVTKIEELLNTEVDLSKPYNEITDLLSYKAYLINAIKSGLLKPLEDSDNSIYDYLKLMKNGNVTYKTNFDKVKGQLENYFMYSNLPTDFVNKVKEVIELINAKETETDTQEEC